jgi:hypothetical protein
MKNFSDIIGNRTRDLPAVAQSLSQLPHRVPLRLRGVAAEFEGCTGIWRDWIKLYIVALGHGEMLA